jgi:hypothetical protein
VTLTPEPFDLFFDGEQRVAKLEKTGFTCNLVVTEDIREWVARVIAVAQSTRDLRTQRSIRAELTGHQVRRISPG